MRTRVFAVGISLAMLFALVLALSPAQASFHMGISRWIVAGQASAEEWNAGTGEIEDPTGNDIVYTSVLKVTGFTGCIDGNPTGNDSGPVRKSLDPCPGGQLITNATEVTFVIPLAHNHGNSGDSEGLTNCAPDPGFICVYIHGSGARVS